MTSANKIRNVVSIVLGVFGACLFALGLYMVEHIDEHRMSLLPDGVAPGAGTYSSGVLDFGESVSVYDPIVLTDDLPEVVIHGSPTEHEALAREKKEAHILTDAELQSELERIQKRIENNGQ